MAELDASRWRWILPGVLVLSTFRWIFRILKWLAVSVAAAIAFIFLSNLLLFPTYRHIPSRALERDAFRFAHNLNFENSWCIRRM